MQNKDLRNFVVLAGAIFLATASIIGIRLVEQNTSPPRADSIVVSLIQTGPSSVTVGQTLPVNVSVLSPVGIIGIRATLKYAANGPFTLSESGVVGKLGIPWSYQPVTISTSGNITTVIIEAYYARGDQTGYTAASTAQLFATLNFKAANPGNMTLNFDGSSLVLAKIDNQNILNTTPSATYTSTNVVVPSLTPTTPVVPSLTPTTAAPSVTPSTTPVLSVTPSITPVASATPTSSVTPVATLTPLPGPGGGGSGETNRCNGTCGSNHNCNAGLYCKNGYCRNPFCDWETDCACKGPTATPSPIVIKQYQNITTYTTNTQLEIVATPQPTLNQEVVIPGEDVSPAPAPTPTPTPNSFWTLFAGLNKYLLAALLIPVFLILFFAYQLARSEAEKPV